MYKCRECFKNIPRVSHQVSFNEKSKISTLSRTKPKHRMDTKIDRAVALNAEQCMQSQAQLVIYLMFLCKKCEFVACYVLQSTVISRYISEHDKISCNKS